MGRLLSALVVGLTAAAMVVMAQDHALHDGGEGPATAGYAAANAAMHEAIAIEYSGDPYVDFARAMIPRHQGAIDMAEVVLANGNDPDLRKFAEEIIAAQQSGDRLPPAVAGRPRRQPVAMASSQFGKRLSATRTSVPPPMVKIRSPARKAARSSGVSQMRAGMAQPTTSQVTAVEG
jgi:hypothetical protein